MFASFDSILRDRCQLNWHQPLLVGVSGGPDSLFLLEMLRQVGIPVIVAHLDHALRPESSAEAEAVRNIAADFGLPCVLQRIEVTDYAAVHHLSVEEAARTLRYRFLFEQAGLHGAQAVAVGHTANDQVETVLMHLLRGAGLSGLKGMSFRLVPNAWSGHIPLVRPLLATWRADLMKFLQARGLQPNLDSSNQDVRYFRNKLRHELLPYLQSYNPNIQPALWRLADILSEDYRIILQATDRAWDDCLVTQGPDFVLLSLPQLDRQLTGIQRHLIRRALEQLRPGLRDIDFQAVDRALKFLEELSSGAQADLVAGLRLLKEDDRLWLSTWEADLPSADWPQISGSRPVDIPGEVVFIQGWRLQATIQSDLSPQDIQVLLDLASQNPDPYQAWINGAAVSRPLQVRARQPGDRLQPLGMAGHALKLSDFMINRKLPRRARAAWPLVVSGDEIVWVPGYQLCHPYRLTLSSQQVIHLRLQHS